MGLPTSKESTMTKPIVGDLRNEAISRLATIVNLPTPEERQVQAEWIVDAILRAAVADVTQRMLDASTGPCARPPGVVQTDHCEECGYPRADHAAAWATR